MPKIHFFFSSISSVTYKYSNESKIEGLEKMDGKLARNEERKSP